MVLSSLVFISISASAQVEIGGIVNSYYHVSTVLTCDSTVVITDPAGLKVGDRVLILQMKGALINQTNDQTFGDLASLESAGCVEYMTIKAIRGNTVEFDAKFFHQYQSEHKVQMVRVAQYADVDVTSTLTAKPWDGTTGGVIALEVTGALRLMADINADSAGFRGGLQGGHLSMCDFTDYNSGYAARMGGAKGESVVNMDDLAARGKLLAGGGGGNANNAGGGGGGNGGRGGLGGNAVPYCANNQVGGVGGQTLADHIKYQRLFLGSGGGGGHENRGQSKVSFEATAGVSGGGLIIIRTRVLHSNGHTISADGANAKISGWDGAGGGGAGGTIFIEAEIITGQLHADARGGNGGDVGFSLAEPVYQAQGPGGGGGGGVIVLPNARTGVITDVAGGRNGTHTEPRSTHYNDPRGALAGEPGVVLTEFTWGTPKYYELEAGGDATICPVGSAMLWAKPGFFSYRWSTGDTSRIATISSAGTYFVEAIDSLGCTHRVDNITVVVDPSQFKLDTATDFGSCDLNVPYFRTIRYQNLDDEYAVINSISVPSPFTIVSPALPAVIQPGQSVDIVISLVATVEGELEETLRLTIQSPCADSAFTKVRSRVNPVYSNFIVGNTVAHVGDHGVQVPVTMQMLQDSTHLDNVTLRFDLTMDSRAFAPTSLSRGRRLRDLIDFVANTRTITIEIDSVYIRENEEVLTVLEGTILNSALEKVPVDISNLTWVVASRDPITTVTPGTITVIGGCAANLRAVSFVEMPSAKLHPNPASDNVTIDVGMTQRGEYAVSIYDVEGRTLFKYTDYHVENTTRIVPLRIPVDQWDSGTYVVMFNSPAKTQAFPLNVVK